MSSTRVTTEIYHLAEKTPHCQFVQVTHATSMKHRQGFIQFLTNQLKLSQVQELDESLIQGTLLGNT